MQAPKIIIPGGRPKHQKQLQMGHPLGSTNCGPTTELVGLEASSENELRPRRENRAKWITAIRRPMTHGSGWPATTLGAIEQSVNSTLIARRMRSRGHGVPHGNLRRVTHEQAIDLLKEGRYLHVAINYGTLNDLMPNLSGSETYRGGHAIGLYGHVFAEGRHWTYLYDPLHDGRRAGIPKGVQTVRVRRYLRAAEKWGAAGPGAAWVVVIK